MVQPTMMQPIQFQTSNIQTNKKDIVSPGEAQAGFSANLKDAIQNLNTYQLESDKKTEALARGEIDNLHDVMITAQKASISLTTAVEIQRKALDAYNEVIRMQI